LIAAFGDFLQFPLGWAVRTTSLQASSLARFGDPTKQRKACWLAAIFYHLISGLDRTRRRLNLRNKQVLESILAQDPNKARIQGLPEQWLVTHLMVSRAYHLIVG